jgi:hypothetical protein
MLSLNYEYKVVPAPRRAQRDAVAKTTEARFAASLTNLMNDMGREGWEYQRADTLPVEERVGLTGSKTTYQNMLVFRRVLIAHSSQAEPMNEELLYPDVMSARPATIRLPKVDVAAKPRQLRASDRL